MEKGVLVEDQQWQGVTDGSWKGKKRIQMTRSHRNESGHIPGKAERLSLTCGPGLPCGLWKGKKESSQLKRPTQRQEKGKWCISNGRLRENSQRLSRLCLSDGVSWQTRRAPQGTLCLLLGCKRYSVFNIILLPFCLAGRKMMWV